MVLTEEHRKLVESHVGLARGVAARVYRDIGGRAEFDDVLSHALAGLIEAASRYDPSMSTPFGLFAFYRVRGAAYDGLRRMGYLQRRGGRVVKRAVKRPGASCDAAGTEPATRPAPPCFVHLSSLEAEEEEGCLDLLSSAPPADAVLAHKHARIFLTRALRKLSGRERRFILKHYFQGKTMIESGAELGLSRYQSCRLHARAVGRLRTALAAEGIERLADV